MKVTNSYVAKRALIDRLTTLAATPGNPLNTAGVQVSDAYPRDLTGRCIYGGGARFVQQQVSAEQDLIREETVTTSLYVRVYVPGLSQREAETEAETIGDAVGAALAADPELAGGLTFTQIAAGAADFYPSDDATEAILALSCQIESYLS